MDNCKLIIDNCKVGRDTNCNMNIKEAVWV